MSLAKKSFVTAVIAPIALAAFGLAAANDAQAEVAVGCRKPADVPALKEQVLKQEGMVPVASRFGALSETEFVQDTVMMNPQTRMGLEWSKLKDGTVCIMKRYSEMEIYDNNKFDGRALMTLPGKDPKQVAVNSLLATASLSRGENPMIKAVADVPTNASKSDPVNYPTRYVEYMLGNPKTTKGSLLPVNLEGRLIPHYVKAIPTPQEYPVQYGAIYTPVGTDLLKGSRVADAGTPTTTLALNKN